MLQTSAEEGAADRELVPASRDKVSMSSLTLSSWASPPAPAPWSPRMAVRAAMASTFALSTAAAC